MGYKAYLTRLADNSTLSTILDENYSIDEYREQVKRENKYRSNSKYSFLKMANIQTINVGDTLHNIPTMYTYVQ